MQSTKSLRVLLAVLVAAIALPASFAAPGDNFRFLTQSLPDGAEDAEYAATLIAANGGGDVTFGVSAGALPPGLSLDPATGRVSGIPTAAGSYPVTLSADDGLSTALLPVTVAIGPSAAARGHLANTDLDGGRVGSIYYEVLTVVDGVGPFVFGSAGLPRGLTLNGSTGQIQGSPAVAGTFHVRISAIDRGDGDHMVWAVLPLVVLPDKSDIAFTTVLLRNGEVDRPYADTWGAGGNPSFDASGLPPDLGLDTKSGDVTGIPATAGTFPVTLTAKSRGDTIVTTLPITVAPSTTSTFHWARTDLPPAVTGIAYAGLPPVQVATRGGTAVAHSAVGLPAGIVYDAATGALSGTAADAGVYPVTFTATDGAGGPSISFPATFVVLPPGGGDASEVAVNLWVTKQTLSTGRPGSDGWKGRFVYNADRRTDRAFDPLTDSARFSLGSRVIRLDPGDLVEVRPGVHVFKDTEQDGAILSVKVYPAKQQIRVRTKLDTIPDRLNRTLENVVVLGNRGFCLEEQFTDGKLLVTPGYETVAFVVDKLKLALEEDDTGTVALSAKLIVPDLLCEPGTALRLRVLEGAEVLLDKDLTDLIGVEQVTDPRTRDLAFVLRKNDADTAETDRLTKFRYDSRKGKLKVTLRDADMSGISSGEAHLAVELTVDDRVYYTALTVFSPRDGRYSAKMPKR